MYRHTVHWQYDSSAAGTDDPSYTTYLRNWPCRITPVSGGETYRGRQIEATATHLIEGRWFEGYSPTMRLYDEVNSRYLNIQRIFDRDGTRQNIEVHATEVVA